MGKNDIDDIFATKKTKLPEQTKAFEPTTTKGTPKIAATSTEAFKKRGSTKPDSKVASSRKEEPTTPRDDLFTDLKGSKRRKTTEEGFKVYDDEELKIDPNAGNTDECPFDCSCCF